LYCSSVYSPSAATDLVSWLDLFWMPSSMRTDVLLTDVRNLADFDRIMLFHSGHLDA
jgi:hypothetical protein